MPHVHSMVRLFTLGSLFAATSASSSLRASPAASKPVSDHSALQQVSLIQVQKKSSGTRESSGKCTFDHSDFDTILRKFVDPARRKDGIRSTLFNYEGILASDGDLEKLHGYVDSLASFKPSCLSANGKLAFWINTYNALIINFILGHAQKDGGHLPASIKDLKGSKSAVWNRKAGTVGGEVLTLEEVLTNAAALGDPRIHSAVNCASLSCPDLRDRAYTESGIQNELDTQVKTWLKNPTKGAKIEGTHLLVSPIFEWHAQDFSAVTVATFVSKSLGLTEKSSVEGYLSYNWKLNSASKSQTSSLQSARNSASASTSAGIVMAAMLPNL